MTRFVTCGIFAACVMVSARQEPIFRGGSDIVHVFATVTDRDGKLVSSLTREDFEVRDEGKPQPLTQFDNSPQPIRLIVMLDVSGSMEGNLPLLRAAGEQLFSRLRPDDAARVGAFGHEITISPSFTHDAGDRRKVILVLSDGKDTGAQTFGKRPVSQAEAIDRARREDVMI